MPWEQAEERKGETFTVLEDGKTDEACRYVGVLRSMGERLEVTNDLGLEVSLVSWLAFLSWNMLSGKRLVSFYLPPSLFPPGKMPGFVRWEKKSFFCIVNQVVEGIGKAPLKVLWKWIASVELIEPGKQQQRLRGEQELTSKKEPLGGTGTRSVFP